MSGARSRNRGAETEQATVRYLRDAGWDADSTRNRSQGKQSLRGDIWVGDIPHATIEVKGGVQPRIVTWLGQLEDEAQGQPCKALIWRVPGRSDPAEWLVFAANHPLDFWQDEIGQPLDAPEHLGKPALAAVVGWLDIEWCNADPGWRPEPALHWCDPGYGEFLLMRLSSFVTEVLPRWEGLN